jgi:hypothetical protein
MANGVGLQIEADDFNTIRNKIVNVLGTGAGNFGYGQSIQSSSVSSGQDIEAQQWNNLRWDIFNVLVHQTGSNPSIVAATVNNVIRYGAGEPNFQYNTLSDTASSNRFNLGTGQFAIEAGITVSQSVSFSSIARCTITVNFNTAEQARYFFNSGGKIRLTSIRTGGSSSSQNTTWSNLLSSIGTRAFDGNSPGVNFYTLTNVEQIWVRQSPTGVYGYSGNEYRISVSCNQPTNIVGGATQVIFKVEWIDGYTDPFPLSPPPDLVDGTLSLFVDQIRATGTLQPTGNPFSVVGPSSYLSSGFITS